MIFLSHLFWHFVFIVSPSCMRVFIVGMVVCLLKLTFAITKYNILYIVYTYTYPLVLCITKSNKIFKLFRLADLGGDAHKTLQELND